MGLVFQGADGRAVSLDAAARGEPLVLVFADYGCTTLCGPALAITGQRLADSGLRPGVDYRLAVVGLDPASTPVQAQAFGRARLPAAVFAAAELLTGSPPAIARATRAVGYGYVWDPEAKSFAHPVSAFVLKPDGRLSGVLSEVALTAPGFRDAVDAANRAPAPASFVEQVALVCHGALAALGRFDAPAILGMRLGGVATLLAGALGVAWMVRRRRAA